MRKAALALAIALAACTTSSTRPPAPTPPLLETLAPSPTPQIPTRAIVLDARAFAAALRESRLPVENVRVLTIDNDPNELLGKPGGYNGKVSWTDTRVRIGQPTAEMFPDDVALQDRFVYLDRIAKRVQGSPYMFRNDQTRVLLRVPAGLTAVQAREYEVWLMTLVWPRYIANEPKLALTAPTR